MSYGGSYVSVHRLIAMYSRREKTLSSMVCHHIDGNMLNASVDNLEVMPIGLHLALHLTGTKHSDEARHKMSESHTGMKYSDEMREKLRVANTGKVMSDETKRKISNTKKGTIFTEEAKRKMSVSAKKRWSTVPPPKKDFNLHLTSAPE
uniref:Nuclease associated modular domain-containing protein n=1 Tax=viral metagenome TaxID=1070528 RepID=A0A6H1ZHK2_9ZZZZ